MIDKPNQIKKVKKINENDIMVYPTSSYDVNWAVRTSMINLLIEHNNLIKKVNRLIEEHNVDQDWSIS